MTSTAGSTRSVVNILLVDVVGIDILQVLRVIQEDSQVTDAGVVIGQFVEVIDANSTSLEQLFCCLLYTSPSPRDRG